MLTSSFFIHSNSRPIHPNDVDKIISVEISDRENELELFKIVSSFMIHGPCGVQNFKSPCMQNGKCAKYFPKKKIVDTTTIDADRYPMYRRDNGVTMKKGKSFVDNRLVS